MTVLKRFDTQKMKDMKRNIKIDTAMLVFLVSLALFIAGLSFALSL